MATNFSLILSTTVKRFEYELTCAISGEADGWRSTSRFFANRGEVETALRGVGVISPAGPNQMMDAAASSIPVAFALKSATPAVALQLLYRVDPKRKLERTMVTFNDLNGSYPFSTAHHERDHPIVIGEKLEVETPMGKRVVEVLAINKSEIVPYGSEETRRKVIVDIRF